MNLLRAVAVATCLLGAGCGGPAASVGTGTAPPTSSVSSGTSNSSTVSSPPLGPATTATGAPFTRPPAHGVIPLTSADANATFLVTVGQSVQLTLSDPGSQWGTITVTPAGLLVASRPTPASPPQGQLGVWSAAKPGTAKVTAVATAYCPTGNACAMWARLFAVTLVIS